MNVDATSANDTWQEVQLAVETLSDLARQRVSPDHFYGELVGNLARLTAAAQCRIWTRETSVTPQSWRIVKSTNSTDLSSRSAKDEHTAYLGLVAESSASQGRVLEAGFECSNRFKLPFDSIFQPVTVDGEASVVIELAHQGDRSPSQRESTRHLVKVAAEIASDFQRNWELRQLRDREDRRENLDRFLDHIHQSYDLRRVAYAIVAEGKQLIDCDRLSLVLTRGRRCRVVAVSGVQKPDRRSPTVLSIESLAKSNIRTGEPIWSEPQANSKDASLTKYFDESNAASVGLLPLISDTDPKRKPVRIGTLLVETFKDHEDRVVPENDLLRARANWLVRHATNALSNAVHVNRLPLLSVGRWLDRNVTRGRRIPWLLLFALPLMVALWFAAWMPTDFRIQAKGELVPVARESIYSPRAGTVIDFPLHDAQSEEDESQGTRVEPGDVVVRLENADLEYELTSLLGEQSTIEQQLETIAASIGQFGGARDAESRKRYEDLTAQSAELKVKQTSIARRIRLVNKEREKLAVKATITGRILTWDVVNSLMLRPVQQGDRLLEVVDMDGEWEIELFVRDRHIGYVKRAQDEIEEPLSISFFHRSDPEREFLATIKSVAMSTEVYPEYGSAVRVVGKLDPSESMEDFRPGTTIVAKIDCGKKPLAYVLCYDLVHTIRMWFLF